MDNSSNLTFSIALLTFTGLVSGVVATYMFRYDYYGLALLPGALLGTLLPLSLKFLGKPAGRWWFPIFPLVSAIAFLLAVISTALPDAVMRVMGRDLEHTDSLDPARFFISGFIGSAVWFAAGIRPFFLRALTHDRTVKLGIIWCLAGALLGLLGLIGEASVGSFFYTLMGEPHGSSTGIGILDTPYSVYPIWQTGMAFLLAIMLNADERSPQNQERQSASISSTRSEARTPGSTET